MCIACRYETWRSKRLSRPKVGTKVRNFAISTLVPVALAFYCAKNGVDMHTVSPEARWMLLEGLWDCQANVKAALLTCCCALHQSCSMGVELR